MSSERRPINRGEVFRSSWEASVMLPWCCLAQFDGKTYGFVDSGASKRLKVSLQPCGNRELCMFLLPSKKIVGGYGCLPFHDRHLCTRQIKYRSSDRLNTEAPWHALVSRQQWPRKLSSSQQAISFGFKRKSLHWSLMCPI